MLTAIFSPFYIQQYPALIAELLNITARGERIFGPHMVNVRQNIPSGRAIYYLSVTVLPYRSFEKYLDSPRFFPVTIPVRIK
jgi:hypothetical protein